MLFYKNLFWHSIRSDNYIWYFRLMNSKRAILVILDGWGHGQNPKVSAIDQARTPFVDSLYDEYPNSELITYGLDVGLPEGQMGNSEVGHLNIGAGRVVYQELARINKAIQEKTFEKNPVIIEALQYAKENNKAIHLLGLVSDGGVHSHVNHLKAICNICHDFGLPNTFIHAFMDGRDTAPTGGADYLSDIQNHIKDLNVKVASVVGRYFAMDRDQRWERIKLAYDLLVHGTGKQTKDPIAELKASYDEKVTDEFIQPIVCTNDDGTPVGKIKEGDVVLFYNFRTDRPRQLTRALTQEDFPEQKMQKLALRFLTMTRYDNTYENIDIIYEKDDLVNTLGEVLEAAGKSQVRIAETEKYPHVTFFFSGGREAPFENERRLMVASPKVATYDLQPEMSAPELTETIIDDIRKNQPDFICLNYANTDMVGHTGDFEAAKRAAEVVDTFLEDLMKIALRYSYTAIIIADHGNSDLMINEDGTPHTAHTTNPVPCFLVANNIDPTIKLSNGRLADVAPTILDLLGVEQPSVMTGKSLIRK